MNDPKTSLEIALSATPPLPANRHEDCQACRRKLNIEADPILDRLPAYRGEKECDRLNAILDEIDRGQG
jgi:hypothetical protein